MDNSLHNDMETPAMSPEDKRTSTSSKHDSVAEEEPVPTTTQHENTDSMVTIRLSSPGIPESSEAAASETADKDIQPAADDEAHIRSESMDVEDEEDETTESVSLPSTEDAVTTRAASPATQSEDYVESPINLSSAQTTHLNHDEASSLRSSSASHLADHKASHSGSLGAELDEVSRSRSLSDGSSKSGSSIKVDWEKLDKNEQQEERDEGTDEVGFC